MLGSPDLKDDMAVISTAISVGAAVYAWLTRQGSEALKKASALEAKIDILEDRVAQLEGELKGVPDRESVHKMQLEMVAMRGSIDVMNERLVPLGAISKRLQDFLLEQANK